MEQCSRSCDYPSGRAGHVVALVVVPSLSLNVNYAVNCGQEGLQNDVWSHSLSNAHSQAL
ncbi:hypothetical protein JZ751_008361 [Albula glossodonta]|uniref:Uncharacterized protein n=1 Tax=Albula glossodonta TaxID=121402 RepID=A0A8T2MPI1_9TELE|nr:hypothetical protein JZ751_008361 [Albula glossodonta]